MDESIVSTSGTSRKKFMTQVGLAVFAAVPVAKAVLFPDVARAGVDPPDCEYVTCTKTSQLCCTPPGNLEGNIYRCLDNFTHDFCYTICVSNGQYCV